MGIVTAYHGTCPELGTQCGDVMTFDPMSELVWFAQPGASRGDYLEAALEMFGRVFPSDSLGWIHLDAVSRGVDAVGTPSEVAGALSPGVKLFAVIPDHPMVLSYLNPWSGSAPRRMSDLVSLTELKRTRAYAEMLHPLGGECQFTILTERRGFGLSAWMFNRRVHDFADDDVLLAGRLQPFLALIDRTWPLDTHALDPGEGLTRREIEVLGLVAQGLTVAAIGFRLGISPLTVSKHLEHAYRKLRCGDRLVAVDRARRLGLIASN